MCLAVLIGRDPAIWANKRGRYWSAKIDAIFCDTLAKTIFRLVDTIGVNSNFKIVNTS
jgi:hypothetical protein